MIIQPLNQLLEKEVDRKEFILYMGIVLFAVTGVSGIWKRIGDLGQEKTSKGFGGGPYGA